MTEQKQNVQDDVFDIEEPKKSSWKSLITLILVALLGVVGFFILKNPIASWLKDGDTVDISYSITLDDGTVVDLVTGDHPKSVVVWASDVLVFNDLLLGMKEWESKKISVSPDDWAGKYYDPWKIKKVPKVLFDNLGEEVIVWKKYSLGKISGIVLRIEWEESSAKVVLDTNDPETRQNINYEVTVIKIK